MASYIFPFRSNDLHHLLATAVRCDSVTCFLPKCRHGLMFAVVIVTVRYLTHRPFPLPDIRRQIRVGYLTDLVVKVTRKMGIMKCKAVKVFRITFQQNLWHVSCCMEKFVYGLTQSVFYFKSVCLKLEARYKFLGKAPISNLNSL